MGSGRRGISRQLQFRGERSPSLGPKAAIIAWYLFCVAVAVWLTFFVSREADPQGNPNRQGALLACAVIYVARAAHTLFVYVKRAIPWWEAVWGGSLIGVVLFVFLLRGLPAPQPFGPLDTVGVLLFVAGSYLGTASEHSRHVWKARPENQGRLYTQGLFRLSRHINYFGDLLVFGGLGALTRQPWTVFVPLAMALNFALVIIPAHDAYLAARYGGEFDDYARRTRKLIPLVY